MMTHHMLPNQSQTELSGHMSDIYKSRPMIKNYRNKHALAKVMLTIKSLYLNVYIYIYIYLYIYIYIYICTCMRVCLLYVYMYMDTFK